MFCKNCGNLISEADKFCQSCGAPIAQDTIAPASQTSETLESQVSQQAVQNPIGMKWYKFVVNVQLFLSMLMCVYNGYMYLSGTMYGGEEEREIVYTVFPKLKTLDIVFGIIYIIYIGFLIIIRYRLVKFKKNAPTLYILNFLIQNVLEWVWVVNANSYVSKSGSDLSFSSSDMVFRLIFCLIYILLNIVYFRKRKFMFDK
ncbi:MAG: zinc ribbon domain-containing protein [Oscillospiraceae bacterium]|nr:zinc ribbon domain-containing protein [Oscillospiraceae bacterium]